ncbi:MAG: hypothetical protein QW343_00065 [Candidatus Norongarragalinales archaeon]
MGFVSMTIWVFLMLLAVGIYTSLLALLKPKEKQYYGMLKLGVFLAVFDFFFESWGAAAGYWVSKGSLLPLNFFSVPGFEGVPFEVFVIALCAGATYALLFPKKFDWRIALPTNFLIACIGAGIESLLISSGNLVYKGGWTSVHALLAYFAVFLLLNWVNAKYCGD